MSASLRPHYRRSRSASAVRFTRPLKPPQSSFYCCKGPTPAEKPRSSPRKPITAFPSGEKLRLTRGKTIELNQSCGDHTLRNEFKVDAIDDLDCWSRQRSPVEPPFKHYRFILAAIGVDH